MTLCPPLTWTLQLGWTSPITIFGKCIYLSTSLVKFILARRPTNVCLTFTKNHHSGGHCWKEARRFRQHSVGWVPELERSNCISLKTLPEFWMTSPGGWYLQLLGGCAVLCRSLGLLWGFQIVPTQFYLGPSYHLPLLFWLPALQPLPPGRALTLPEVSQCPGWLAVSREMEKLCPLRGRPEKWSVPCVC